MNDIKRSILALLIAAVAVTPSHAQESEEIAEVEVEAPAVLETLNAPESFRQLETGLASFYHVMFHGRRTANGEKFSNKALTAAHPTLPFGTRLRVINLTNNRSVIVRVNDRGPMLKDRIIDLTQRAARELGFQYHGIVKVEVEIVPAEQTLGTSTR